MNLPRVHAPPPRPRRSRSPAFRELLSRPRGLARARPGRIPLARAAVGLGASSLRRRESPSANVSSPPRIAGRQLRFQLTRPVYQYYYDIVFRETETWPTKKSLL